MSLQVYRPSSMFVSNVFSATEAQRSSGTTMITFSAPTSSSSATASTTFTKPTFGPTASPSAQSTANQPRISVSAALGIGFAAGVISTIILLTAGLFFYRCWKVRRSPAVQYYEQARLWKGFTPATPNTARTTLIESKMANIYFAELRSPATPAFTLSPPLGGPGRSWPVTPLSPKARSSVLPL